MEKAAEVRGKSNETVRDAHGGGHGGNRAVNVMLSTLLHCWARDSAAASGLSFTT